MFICLHKKDYSLFSILSYNCAPKSKGLGDEFKYTNDPVNEIVCAILIYSSPTLFFLFCVSLYVNSIYPDNVTSFEPFSQ